MSIVAMLLARSCAPPPDGTFVSCDEVETNLWGYAAAAGAIIGIVALIIVLIRRSEA